MIGSMELLVIFLPLVILFLFIAFSRNAKPGGQPGSDARKPLVIVLCVVLGLLGLTLLTVLLAASLTPRPGGGGGPSILGMVAFLAIVALVVLAFGCVVAMIINPRTRPWGIALAVAGPILVLGFLTFIWFLRGQPVAQPIASEQPATVSYMPERIEWHRQDVSYPAATSHMTVRAEPARAGTLLNFLVIPLLLLLLAAIGGLVAMVVNPKTRPWGIGLLGALAVPVIVVVVLVLPLRLSLQEETARAHTQAALAAQGEALRSTHQPIQGVTIPVEEPSAPEVEPPKAAASSDETPQAAEGPAEKQREAASKPAKKPTAPSKKPAAPAKKPAVPDKSEPRPSGSGPAASPDAPLSHGRGSGKDTKRPDWVDAPPGMVGGEYRCTVVVGPYTTRMECDREMLRELRPAVDEYVRLYLGDELARRWDVRLGDQYIRQNVVRATWEELKQTIAAPDPMPQLHVLLAFDRKTNDLLRQMLRDTQRNALVEERLIVAGVALAGVLAVLAVAYAVLKTDIVTKGAYRQQMLLAAVAVALGLIGGSILFYAPRDDVAGGICVFPGLPLLAGGIAMTASKKLRRFGVALLGSLALASFALLRYLG